MFCAIAVLKAYKIKDNFFSILLFSFIVRRQKTKQNKKTRIEQVSKYP